MESKKIKKIATWIVVPLMVSIFVLDIFTVIIGNRYARKYMPVQEKFKADNTADRIHFLNTGNSDCILLESNGHFALIDSGEGNNNPRRKTAYKGFEEDVLSYLNKVCAENNGEIYLDFILGTHYHYDHIGCFHTIITDSRVKIGKAYFKEYNYLMDEPYEYTRWGLPDFYKQIKEDLESKNIPLFNTVPDSIDFYDFDLKLFNTGYYPDLYGKGENASSIGIKVVKGSKSAFLASDITGPSGVEEKVGEKVGHIDLLKIGHHGYYGSSSMKFLSQLTPEIAVVTNQQGKVYPNVKWNLTMHAKVPFYGTYDYNGIIASFTDDGEIKLTGNIQ